MRSNGFGDAGGGSITHHDAVGNIEVERFPLVLHQAVEIAGHTFLLEFRRERGIERHECALLQAALQYRRAFIGDDNFVRRQLKGLPIDL